VISGKETPRKVAESLPGESPGIHAGTPAISKEESTGYHAAEINFGQ
jgi:hypothetical protein